VCRVFFHEASHPDRISRKGQAIIGTTYPGALALGFFPDLPVEPFGKLRAFFRLCRKNGSPSSPCFAGLCGALKFPAGDFSNYLMFLNVIFDSSRMNFALLEKIFR
jgi:hypothetical protein